MRVDKTDAEGPPGAHSAAPAAAIAPSTGTPALPVDAPEPTAHAGLFDIGRLLAHLAVGKLRPGFDAQAAGCRWARAAMADGSATRLTIGVAGRGIDLVGSPATSESILMASPAGAGCAPGHLKTEGMAFLAPHALTIAHGDRWRRLRAFNEHVLGTGELHAYAQHFLDRVRDAFSGPVRARDDIRAAMAHAMVGIVIGPVHDGTDRAADDVTALLGAVQSPLRRKLLGFRYQSRRERLYAVIARRLDNSRDTDPTLIALARRSASDVPRDELLQQVPHWMFTFTGSGTDLLTRTLATIASRPTVRQRVLDELRSAGSLGTAATIARLDFLNACLLETGRLFPPVTRTFHRQDGAEAHDIVHYFPLLQRDDALGPDVHHFVPERWLRAERDEVAAASNLFLRGPRACPGADLILFVCRAALARLLGELHVACDSVRLARDPLPLSFPEREARFTVEEASS